VRAGTFEIYLRQSNDGEIQLTRDGAENVEPPWSWEVIDVDLILDRDLTFLEKNPPAVRQAKISEGTWSVNFSHGREFQMSRPV
jgi:hypothetical protein